MGFLDDVKGKLNEVGDQAEDVFEAAKRQAVEAIDYLKAKLDVNDDGVNTVGEVFAAAQAQASGAIAGLKDKISGDDDTPVGEAQVLSEEAVAPVETATEETGGTPGTV